MKPTKHFAVRRSQRGITHAMAEMALKHGEISQDKYVITQKLARKRIEQLRWSVKVLKRIERLGALHMNAIHFDEIDILLDEIRILIKIADTGGLVVVEKDNRLITTYKLRGKVRL